MTYEFLKNIEDNFLRPHIKNELHNPQHIFLKCISYFVGLNILIEMGREKERKKRSSCRTFHTSITPFQKTTKKKKKKLHKNLKETPLSMLAFSSKNLFKLFLIIVE